MEKVILRRQIDPDTFKAYLKERELSIRTLGSLVDVNEKTLRRAIDERRISLTVAVILCEFFKDDCDALFGPDTSGSWRRILSYIT